MPNHSSRKLAIWNYRNLYRSDKPSRAPSCCLCWDACFKNKSTTSCNECLVIKCADKMVKHPTSIATHAQRTHIFICMVQRLCLLHSLDAVPVGATHIIPVSEIQSSVVLRLQMVNVVCLGICSVGQYPNTTSYQQMKPVRELIPTMTCMKQRQPLQHVR